MALHLRYGLTVLCGGHGSRINVHVRIDFDGGDFETGRLEQQARRGGYRRAFMYTISICNLASQQVYLPITPFPIPLWDEGHSISMCPRAAS